MRLLVFDPESMIQHFFKLECEESRDECFSASNLSEYRYYIDDLNPDMLIFGFEIFEQEQSEWLAWWSKYEKLDTQIPVAFYGSQAQKERYESYNFNGLYFILKPFVHKETISRIKSLGNTKN